MGLLFVLIFYAVALTVAAAIGATIMGTIAFLLTRHSSRWKRAFLLSVLFPFACVAFAGGWFIFYAVINSTVLHRDPGLGDGWDTPLPNGYAIMMIDTTDQGTVYNPKTQPISGGVVGRDDAVFGVRQMQVSRGLIFGARDSGYFGHIGQDSQVVDSWFELDTAKGTHTEFNSLAELQQRASNEGMALHLRNIQSVYSDYRFTAFDYLAGAVLLLVPAIGFVALARWIWKIRHAARKPLTIDH